MFQKTNPQTKSERDHVLSSISEKKTLATSLAGKHLWDLWKPQNVARLMASGTDR